MKIVFTNLVVLLILFNISFAADANLPSPEAFIASANGEIVDAVDNGLSISLPAILALLIKIGYVVILCGIAVYAVQLMLASPRKKAELKASVLPFLLGTALIVIGTDVAIKVIELFITIF